MIFVLMLSRVKHSLYATLSEVQIFGAFHLSELFLLNDIKTDLTLQVLFMASHRTCRSSGSSYGATVMQGHNAFEYFSSYAAYYKAALVRETIDQILSELAEVKAD